MKSPRRAGVLRNMGKWENRKNEIKRRSEKSAGAVFVKKGSVMAALRFAPAAREGAYASFGTICDCSLKFNF